MAEEVLKQEEERTRVDVNDSEKLSVVKVENDFLKAQVEIQQLSQRITHLQDVAKKCGEKFVTLTTDLAKKYDVDLKDFGWNNVEQAFLKVPEQK